MKRVFSIVLALLIIISASPVSALADEITSTGENYTSEDGQWKYYKSLDADGNTFLNLCSYLGEETELVIPSRVDGYPVASVCYANSTYNIFGKKGSTSYKYIDKIIISDGIQRIGSYAFAWIDGVSVEISKSVVSIGNNAFYRTVFNNDVIIPEGVIGIEKQAFNYATFTNTDITLPRSLKYISGGVFSFSNITSLTIERNTDFRNSNYTLGGKVIGDSRASYYSLPYSGCFQLTKVSINRKNPYFITEGNVIYTSDYAYLICVNGTMNEFVIPNEVKKIPEGAFINGVINHLTIGSGITVSKFERILQGVAVKHLDFDDGCTWETINCYHLSGASIDEITLPKSIKTLASGAFEDFGLNRLNFPEGCELETIEGSALRNNAFETLDFSNCPKLSELIFNALRNCEQLKSVDLSATAVKCIDGGVFSNCYSLEYVRLPENLEQINFQAFKDDENLKYINLDTVKEIDQTAFSGCPLIELPESILPIAEDLNYNEYTFDEYENSITLKTYNGNDKNVVLPDEINGKKVTKIGALFAGAKKIDTLSLPEHLEEIDYSAFEDCGIKNISPMPSTLVKIGNSAFSSNDFESVELNEGLISIEDDAFFSCDNLTTLRLPNSLIRFGKNNFNSGMSVYFGSGVRETSLTNKFNLTQPKSFYISEDNPYYSAEQGILYNGDKTEIIKAFNNCNMDEKDEIYVVPDSVVKIDEKAFEHYIRSREIVFGKNIRDFGRYSFSGSSFKKAIFKSGFNVDSMLGVFSYSELEEAVFEKGATVKKFAQTFEDTPLNTVVFPEGLEAISNNAFSQTRLSGVIILPKTVKKLDSGAFSYTDIAGINIPDGLEYIGNSVFKGCKKLPFVDLNNVKTLGALAFADCEKLLFMDLTGVTFYESGNNYTFKNCPLLTKLVFKKKTHKTFIDEGACKSMETLNTVVIGESVEEIKDEAFADCKNLKTAYIAPEVERISDSAFDSCDKLTIVCVLGSPAYNYAVKNNITYKTFRVEPVKNQKYTGRAITPSPKVWIGDTVLSNNKDYKLMYANNVKVGKARIDVIGMGDYDIYAATLNFAIVKGNAKVSVKKAVIKKLKAGKRSLTVFFKKQNNVSGYQIQIAKNKKFTKGKKTFTVSGTKTKKSLKKLKANTRYYVRIRAYKKVSGKKHFGKWSKIKSIKTK